LTGTNFIPGAAVNFGGAGVTVSNVVVVSSTRITATFQVSATAALGAQNVSVTTSGGTSGNVTFPINAPPSPPTLTSISPSSGVQGTNVPVTLTGTNFVSGATVNFSGAGVIVSNVVVASGTSITATFQISATAALGAQNVSVTTSAGSTSNVTFTINPKTYAQGPILDPGNFVALNDAGDTAVGGHPGNSFTNPPIAPGITVFVKDSVTGNWSAGATLTLPSFPGGNVTSLGMSGDGQTIVVGDSAGGNVYVYVAAGGWGTATGTHAPDAKLSASDGSKIGFCVAIDQNGDTVVAGPPHSSVPTPGAVYVFVMPAGGWSSATPPTQVTSVATLTETTSGGGNLGISVAIDAAGQTIVGGEDSNNSSFNLHDFTQIYVKPSTGWTTTSTPDATLAASDGAIGDFFGISVSISSDGANGVGTTVVVGASNHLLSTTSCPNPSTTPCAGPGAAYVFLKPTGTGGWKSAPNPMPQAVEFVPSGTGIEAGSFGVATAISASAALIVVGGSRDPVTCSGAPPSAVCTLGPGAAYIFPEPAGGWAGATSPMNQTQQLAASSGTDFNGQQVTPSTLAGSFGAPLAMSSDGGTIAIGGLATIGGVFVNVVYLFQ